MLFIQRSLSMLQKITGHWLRLGCFNFAGGPLVYYVQRVVMINILLPGFTAIITLRFDILR